jgi:alpha-L-rhamnosidase
VLVLNPRCEWLPTPTIATQTPRLAWALSSIVRGDLQTAYHVQVGSMVGASDMWDSGQVTSAAQMVLYAGSVFTSRQHLYWRVRVWNAAGSPSQWAAGTFNVGLLNLSDWNSAAWIGYNTGSITVSSPAACVSKSFTTPNKTITRATYYGSGLGAYVPYCNGTRVDQSEQNPGWTDFTMRRQYQTFDLTSLVKPNGLNVLGLMIGDGRCMSNICNNPNAGGAGNSYGGSVWRLYYYDDIPRAMGTLFLDYSDGTSTQIVTDGTWLAVVGENQANDVYNGSIQDLRATVNFTLPGYAGVGSAVDASVALGTVPLVPQPCPLIKRQETLTAVAMTNPSSGTYILDFGQNHAGICQITLNDCTSGSEVLINMAEDLYRTGGGGGGTVGHLYISNLRSAFNGVKVIATGAATEIAEQMFSVSTGRYAQITGYTGTPNIDTVKRVVVHTDMPTVSTFSCNESLLNGIWTASYWTVSANAQEVPTDCPQRDERLGWMADVAAGVKSYHTFFDALAFMDKFSVDADDELTRYGYYVDTSPFDSVYYKNSVGWAEAGGIVPWENYMVSGDTNILSKHFSNIFIGMNNEPGHDQWGDYLNENDNTNSAVHAALWAYRMSWICNQCATILGNSSEATASALKMATFLADFQTQVTDGTATSQTSYILGLTFGMYTQAQIAGAVASLVALVQANGITCGLLGTAHVLDVLSDNGHHALAVQVALKTYSVSWAYDWANGLTTVPERWEAVTYQANTGANMDNSYCHTVRTAGIIPWLMKRVAGIAYDPASPGFTNIIMAPIPCSQITFGEGTLNTVRGLVSSKWSMGVLGLHWAITVPPNCTGTVVIPVGLTQLTLDNGQPLAVTALGADVATGGTQYRFPSGTYSFLASSPSF